jgi:hypothetical protein
MPIGQIIPNDAIWSNAPLEDLSRSQCPEVDVCGDWQRRFSLLTKGFFG